MRLLACLRSLSIGLRGGLILSLESIFDSVTIELPSGKQMQIHTDNNNPQSNFVSNVQLEGEDYTKLYITHEDILAGKSLDFRLGLAPSYRHYSDEELPFSISKKK